jgi:hypothetical protein
LPKRVHFCCTVALIPAVTPPFVFGVSLILPLAGVDLDACLAGFSSVDLCGSGLVIVPLLAFLNTPISCCAAR